VLNDKIILLIVRLLSHNGISAKTTQLDIIRRVKTSIINNFILESFSPILGMHKNCYYVYVGTGGSRVLKAVMFHVGCFTGDGAGLSDITFTHWSHFEGKSRMHTDPRCYRFIRDVDETTEFRDSEKHAKLLLELRELNNRRIEDKKLRPNGKFRSLHRMEVEAEKTAKAWGINKVGGELLMQELFAYETKWSLHELYRAVPCDILHVVNLGVVKDLIVSIVSIFESIGKLDKRFSGNMGILDLRLQNFPFWQSYSPVTMHSFQFNVSMGTTHDTVINRVKEASWFPPLLLQIMFSIGSDGLLIPNDVTLLEELGIPEIRLWNPSSIILNACVSLFHCIMMLNSPRMWYSETETLQYMCSTALYWIMLVKQLCRILENPATKTVIDSEGISIKTKTYVMPDIKGWNPGEKFFYFREYAAQKREFGADCRTYDTQASEGLHKQIIRPIIARTSKRSSSMLNECSDVVMLDDCVRLIVQSFKTSKSSVELASSGKGYTYPYIHRNSVVSLLNLQIGEDGELLSCEVDTTSFLYEGVDLMWLGDKLIKIVSSCGIDFKMTWAYKVFLHECITVLGEDKEEVKLRYQSDVGKNCCGVTFQLKDSNGVVLLTFARVCGVVEICYPDADDVQHSSYRLIVAQLEETHDPASYLPFPIYRYKAASSMRMQFRCIKPESVKSGVALIPYLKGASIFDKHTDVQTMEFYALVPKKMQYGLAERKSKNDFINLPLDYTVGNRHKCFVLEEFLRLEQEVLGLNKRKNNKKNIHDIEANDD